MLRSNEICILRVVLGKGEYYRYPKIMALTRHSLTRVLKNNNRRTTTAHTTQQATTTAAAIPSSATPPSEEPSASTRGTRRASTTASSTIRERQTWSASRKLRARPSCPTRMRRASPLGNTSTWDTSDRCTRCAVGRSGSSCVHCFGMAGRSRWSRLIGQRGMPSYNAFLSESLST